MLLLSEALEGALTVRLFLELVRVRRSDPRSSSSTASLSASQDPDRRQRKTPSTAAP